MGRHAIIVRIGLKSQIHDGFVDIKQSDYCLTVYGQLLHTGKFKIEPCDYVMLSDFETIESVSTWFIQSLKYQLIYEDDLIAVKFKYYRFTSNDKEVASIIVDNTTVNIAQYIATLAFLNQPLYEVFPMLNKYAIYGFLADRNSIYVGFDKERIEKICSNEKILYEANKRETKQ